MFLQKIVKVLDKNRVEYLLVGGYAVALHGAVRGTVDIDIVIRLRKRDFIAAEIALLSIDLEPRLPVSANQVFDFREDYIKNKNLIAWSFYNPKNPIESVDIIITHDARKMKSIKKNLTGGVIRIASIEGLIEMKSGTGREQDKQDILALKAIK